jgi:hypothetical protein
MIDDGTIELGEVDIYESETVFAQVKNGANKGIRSLVNAFNTGKLNLSEKKGLKLAVYTYRHNYADTGLYQLYVSGTLKYGKPDEGVPGIEYPFKDIQAIQYEFEDPSYTRPKWDPPAEVEIILWRGVVVRVDAEGKVTNVAGSIAGVNAGSFDAKGNWVKAEVKDKPFAAWELASVLKRDAYDPDNGKDRPEYVHPFDRPEVVPKGTIDAKYVTKITDGSIPDPKVNTRIIIDTNTVKPSVKPRIGTYRYNGPRSSYSRLLFGNGR